MHCSRSSLHCRPFLLCKNVSPRKSRKQRLRRSQTPTKTALTPPTTTCTWNSSLVTPTTNAWYGDFIWSRQQMKPQMATIELNHKRDCVWPKDECMQTFLSLLHRWFMLSAYGRNEMNSLFGMWGGRSQRITKSDITWNSHTFTCAIYQFSLLSSSILGILKKEKVIYRRSMATPFTFKKLLKKA